MSRTTDSRHLSRRVAALLWPVLSILLALACRPAGTGAQRAIGAWIDPSPHRVAFVAVAPGVTLEVLDWGGVGPPMVFLSGLQDVAHGFDDFAPRFTDQYHVIGITRRGYGASAKPASGYEIATRVADLHAVLDSLRLMRVDLVGHSIAGDELTAFAGRYPDRVSHLVYLDAAYDHSHISALFRESPAPPPMLAADSASPAAVQAYTLRIYGMHIPEAQLRAIGRYDASDHLAADITPAVIDSLMLAGCGHPDYAKVHAPVLVIDAVEDSAPELFHYWSTLDSTGRRTALRITTTVQDWKAAQRTVLLRNLPAAQVVRLPGANHYVFDSHPDAVTSAMRTFLAAQ